MSAMVTALSKGLRQRGFQRDGRVFRRWVEDAVHIVTVQGSSINIVPINGLPIDVPPISAAEFYVNLYADYPAVRERFSGAENRRPRWSRYSTRVRPPSHDGRAERWLAPFDDPTANVEAILTAFDAEDFFQSFASLTHFLDTRLARAREVNFTLDSLLAAEILGREHDWWSTYDRTAPSATAGNDELSMRRFLDEMLDRHGRSRPAAGS